MLHSLYLTRRIVKLSKMEKSEEKDPISFKVLQVFFALTAFASSIFLIISLYFFTISGMFRSSSGRGLIESGLALIFSIGMLKRRKWAWIVNIFSGVVGSLAILFELSMGKADYSPLWLVASIGIGIYIYLHRPYYNR